MAGVDLNDEERRRQYESFVANNPGDEGRAGSALGFDVSGMDLPTSHAYAMAPTIDTGTGNPTNNNDNSPGPNNNLPGPAEYQYKPGDTKTGNPWVDGMINRDQGAWMADLQAYAKSKGVAYDPSDLAGVIRQVSYKQNAAKDPLEFINQQKAIYDTRARPTASAGGTGGTADQDGKPGIDPGWVKGPGGQYTFSGNPNDPRTATTAPPPTGPGYGNDYRATPTGYNPPGLQNVPPHQFNDPYSKLLEEIAQNQLKSLTGANPQVQQLMDFLNKRFGELSNSNGYSPDELSLLNTQTLAPIESLRKASQQRELERTSRAGYLPSSGITLDQQRQIDTGADQMRTAANRDLGINNINQRTIRQNEALQLAQMGVQIPQQQNAQALDVANILYNMPRQAMLDANSIVNGSSPQSAIGPYIQLLQNRQQQNLLSQQQNQQFWDAIGRQILSLFGGG